MHKSWFRIFEYGCWCSGFVLCGLFLSHVVQGEVQRVQDLHRVNLAWSVEVPDTSLWSEGRIRAWEEARGAGTAEILAVLDIPDIELEVPVYAGASDLDMDRGAGWIPGTARPGEAGNVGIAGHRDGYFRVLKDAEVGDTLELRTASGRQRYVIDEILIVDPLDVEVLETSDDRTLTLVTCYPFYFVGSAPQRYIVRAQQVSLDTGRFSTTLE
jgi:sortase A